MKKSLFFIGLVVFLVGAIDFLGLTIQTVSGYIDKIFSFVPLPQQYSAVIFAVVGLVLMGLSFHSKMGKYYKFY